MTPNTFSNLKALIAAGALLSTALVGVAAPTPRQAPAPVPAAAPVEPPKSVFLDRPDFGRDPFFPKSTRRGAVVSNNPVIEPAQFAGGVVLKGISGTVDKRLAIINNKTFEAGEEADVTIGGQRVRIKCVEIGEKSVTVMVNGVSKELFLGKL